MAALWLRQRAAALCLVIVACLLAQLSDASDDRPSFPHLEPRFEALNITCGDEVKDLVRDWQAELNALDGPGGQRASLRLPENKVLERRFAWPFLTERITCAGTIPVACAYQGYSYCCYTDTTCCYTDYCCGLGYSCCNSNPGLCCGASQFCCNLNVCCDEGQICNNGVCSNPAVYVTVTTTSFSTQYSTTLKSIVDSVTSTVQSTIISTIVNTVSNVATATSVIYVTSTITTTISVGVNGEKRTADVEVPITFAPATESVTQKAPDLGPPKVTVGSDKKFDVLAEKLARRGLVVERTVTSTIYITSYSTINSVYTSTISSVQNIYVTSLATNFVTSTVFLNAQTTVDVTSTVILTITIQGTSTIKGTLFTQLVTTSTGSSSPTSGSSTNNPSPDTGLSTGAKAGIGVGSVVGAAAVAALAFAFWWRSRRDNNPSNTGDAVSNQAYPEADPATYPGRPTEMAAVGAAGIAAASARDLRSASYSDAGVTSAVPSSPTNSSMRNTGQWPQPADYQQPLAAPTAYPGYPTYAQPRGDTYSASPSPPPAAYDTRASSRQGFTGGYPQGMAEMVGTNMGHSQGPVQELQPHGNYDVHEIPATQYNQAHEMPTNLQHGGT